MNVEDEKFQEIVMGHLIRLSQADAEMNDRLKNLETIVLRIENDHGEKIQALIDAHAIQLEFNERVDKAFIDVNNRVDDLDKKVYNLDKKVDSLDKRIDHVDKNVDKVVDVVQRIEGKVDLLTLKVSEHDAILGKAR